MEVVAFLNVSVDQWITFYFKRMGIVVCSVSKDQ